MNARDVIIFSAPSGSGKSTLVNHLLAADPRLSFAISATSRPPRGEERHGREYYFLSPDEFRRRVAAGEFLEWEEVYEGRYYGTPRSEIERLRAAGRTVLLDVDVIGGLNVKRALGDRALAIFVQAPSLDELRRRLVARGTDSLEEIEQRLAKAEREMAFAKQFDAVVVNDDLSTAIAAVERLVSGFLDGK
ncbi:MAG: guanylate kinase [Odoribacteraceae bacterium]|jgi:guanylate kinase|nr:guanylate kinase [Odoribacteraceae bacterium]